jgi:hypothetical protein
MDSGFLGAQAPRLLANAPSRLPTFGLLSRTARPNTNTTLSARAPKGAGEGPALPGSSLRK